MTDRWNVKPATPDENFKPRTPNFALMASELRKAADAWEKDGPTAWRRAWLIHSPLKATSGEGVSGGQRTMKVKNEYGEDELIPVTAVEAAAFDPDPLLVVFPAFRQAVEMGYDNVLSAAATIAVLAKNMAGVEPPDDTEGPGEGWCRSCFRDGRYFEPAALNRYANLCRFCGEWKRSEGGLPPMEIMRAKHGGRRITTALVASLKQPPRKKKSKRKAS